MTQDGLSETRAAGRRLVQNSLFMFGQNAVVTAASVFITAVIARHLGKANYGTFNYCFSFVNLFFIFSALGLRSVTVRAVAQEKESIEKYIGLVVALRMVLALLTLPLLLLISYRLHDDSKILVGVTIASGILLFSAFSTSLRDVLQGFEKMSYEAMTAVFVRAFTLFGSLAVIFLGGGLFPLIWIYALGSVVACVVPYVGFRQRRLRLRLRWAGGEALSELRKGLPFALTGFIFIFISKINPVLLGNLSTQETVGIYYAGVSFFVILQAIPDAIATSLFPTVARGYSDPSLRVPPLLQRVFFYLAVLGLPIATGGFLCAGPIVQFVFGPKFLEAVPVFRIFMIAILFEFFTVPASYVLGAIHRQRTVLAISAVAAIFNLASNFLLIPRFGACGAAASGAMTSFLFAVASLFVLSRGYRLFTDFPRYARLFLCAGLMIAAIYPLRSASPLLSVPVATAVYAGSVLLFRVLTWKQASDFVRRSMGGGDAPV